MSDLRHKTQTRRANLSVRASAHLTFAALSNGQLIASRRNDRKVPAYGTHLKPLRIRVISDVPFVLVSRRKSEKRDGARESS